MMRYKKLKSVKDIKKGKTYYKSRAFSIFHPTLDPITIMSKSKGDMSVIIGKEKSEQVYTEKQVFSYINVYEGYSETP